jgi:beta-glucosidase
MTGDKSYLVFPRDFLWGVATSSYQIEGSASSDGKGLSIWDTFCREDGRISDGSTGDAACDHYARMPEDVSLMASMGIKAYRFSVSWPRVVPSGRGQVNTKGLDFYDRLVDELLAHGITPMVTLFHWDLPLALQDEGGWPQRSTAEHFARYAEAVGEQLSDRVRFWITHNEPFVAAMAGHYTGEHAPGIQDARAALSAAHHLLLSHGLAVQALRAAARRPVEIGITLNLNPVHPASDSENDRLAAARADAILNRMFLDPVLRARYPEDAVELFGPLFPRPQEGDLRTVAAPLDFLGVNYYSRSVVRFDPSIPLTTLETVQPPGREYSQMWEIYPEGLFELLTRIWAEYHPPSVILTENGIPVADGPDLDGEVRDYRRVRYYRDHLIQLHRALNAGVPVRGYFAWTFMDNFEWAHGYSKRFGLVYVDFKTLKRTIKESGRWYAQVIRQGGLDVGVHVLP